MLEQEYTNAEAIRVDKGFGDRVEQSLRDKMGDRQFCLIYEHVSGNIQLTFSDHFRTKTHLMHLLVRVLASLKSGVLKKLN
jgi:hypothetical protein